MDRKLYDEFAINLKNSGRIIEASKYLSWQLIRFQQLSWSHSNSFEWWDMHEHKMLTGAPQVSSGKRVVEWKSWFYCEKCKNEFWLIRKLNEHIDNVHDEENNVIKENFRLW